MSVFTALIVVTIAVFSYFVIVATGPLVDMAKNRLLYRSYLTRAEQAMVEKNLSKLARVIVMCDRVDKPTLGFLEAVKDNLASNVKYVFLVSSRATEEEIGQYERIFGNIEVSVRAEAEARAEISGAAIVVGGKLFEVHRLKQDWNDYPYICYEFFTDSEEVGARYLMYRGSEMGAGIADQYVKISPETAYSLFKRADALKSFIAAERDSFVEGRMGSLENQPVENVFPLVSRIRGRKDVEG